MINVSSEEAELSWYCDANDSMRKTEIISMIDKLYGDELNVVFVATTTAYRKKYPYLKRHLQIVK